MVNMFNYLIINLLLVKKCSELTKNVRYYYQCCCMFSYVIIN